MKRGLLSLALALAMFLGLAAPALASAPMDEEAYVFIERNGEDELENGSLTGSVVTLEGEDGFTDCCRVTSKEDEWVVTHLGAGSYAVWVSLEIYQLADGVCPYLGGGEWRQSQETGEGLFWDAPDEDGTEGYYTVRLTGEWESLSFSTGDFPLYGDEKDMLYKLNVHLEFPEAEEVCSILLVLDEDAAGSGEGHGASDRPGIAAAGARDGSVMTFVVTAVGAVFDEVNGADRSNWVVNGSFANLPVDMIVLSPDHTEATLVLTVSGEYTNATICARGLVFAENSGMEDEFSCVAEITSVGGQTIPDTPSADDGTSAGPELPAAPAFPAVPESFMPLGSASSDTNAVKAEAPAAGEDDGVRPVTETGADGTVTTTATDASGSRTVTVTAPSGYTVTTVESADGGSSTTTVTAEGQVTAAVTVSAASVSAARESGQAVALPMPEVPLTVGINAAPAVTVSTGSSQPVKVEIPVERTTPGTVAVIVHADGTEEVVKASLATASGVTLTVADGATVKIVDNSKSFSDAASHWAGDAITFAAAHELFNGTGEDSFTPDGTMTRGMIVTVLARYDGVDTASGDTWYEKGVDWAAERGISSGADLDAPVTREQLAAMLYRYAASSGMDVSAEGALDSFADADGVSGYAVDAMAWAVGEGLISGNMDGTLAPQNSATRAEVAAILMRFCEAVAG